MTKRISTMTALMGKQKRIDVWRISIRFVILIPPVPCKGVHIAQDHADDDDDDDDDEEEEEEESKASASRGGRRHVMGNPNGAADQALVRTMVTGSAFQARNSNSRGPVVGQLISV